MVQKKRVKILLLLIGFSIFCVLIYKVGVTNIYQHLSLLKWKILILLLPFSLVFCLDTLGWKYSFKETNLRFKNLFTIRLAGEAINMIIPSANLAGEPVKAYLLQKHNVPMVEGIASVVISKALMTISQIVFVMIGVGFLLFQLNISGSRLISTIAITLLGIPVIVLILFIQKRGIFSSLLGLLRLFKIKIRYLEENVGRLKALDENILDFYRNYKKNFCLAVTFYFFGWIAGLIEVFLVLNFLGYHVGFFPTYIIESLSTVAKGITSFIPGSVGGQEGGIIMIFSCLKLSVSIGLTLCILRRLRELIWAAAGLILLSKLEWTLAETSKEESKPEF
ncbi:MAG: TIGR00374 family protein [Candidatus Scalindua sp. AMX11]|nr:MAG: TIGR00374 family protein [Candidatus Scalindua sp.]NOG83558.1 flippase-like domain-containing protein [Planctomycetota bacterium]RZV70938.1 MAG: flippase-like domain-containing protein [Candidatus Scalindua sp. SCAELEC01]TDE64245.1 MAG: TIGR00374 family protein [Candidatus Scalindua sp. AMX11]GJQ59962.1 MAG: membrane protein [Candidatus Scalindua sp.]